MKNTLKTIAGASAFMLAALPLTAHADNWYLGASGDLTWPDHADTGGGGNIDLGYRFGAGTMGDFRLEAEAGYHEAPGDSGYGDTRYFTYMGNAYYDFNMNLMSGGTMAITPYIGGGIGDAQVNYGDSSFSQTFHHHNNTFAYQGMAGLNITDASMPNTNWYIGYRYTGTDDNNLDASNLEVGLRYNF